MPNICIKVKEIANQRNQLNCENIHTNQALFYSLYANPGSYTRVNTRRMQGCDTEIFVTTKITLIECLPMLAYHNIIVYFSIETIGIVRF